MTRNNDDRFNANFDDWSVENINFSLHSMREALGMKPVKWGSASCSKCSKNYRTTFVGGRRQQHYCAGCRRSSTGELSDCKIVYK